MDRFFYSSSWTRSLLFWLFLRASHPERFVTRSQFPLLARQPQSISLLHYLVLWCPFRSVVFSSLLYHHLVQTHWGQSFLLLSPHSFRPFLDPTLRLKYLPQARSYRFCFFRIFDQLVSHTFFPSIPRADRGLLEQLYNEIFFELFFTICRCLVLKFSPQRFCLPRFLVSDTHVRFFVFFFYSLDLDL